MKSSKLYLFGHHSPVRRTVDCDSHCSI